MRWSDIPFHPPTATLRWFGAFAFIFLAALAGVQALVEAHWTTAAVLGGLAAVAGLCGLLWPRGLRPIFVGMLVISYPVSWAVSHLLLALVFYCLFTPLALWFKVIGRDALTRRGRSEADSYWSTKPAARDVRSYFRQS